MTPTGGRASRWCGGPRHSRTVQQDATGPTGLASPSPAELRTASRKRHPLSGRDGARNRASSLPAGHPSLSRRVCGSLPGVQPLQPRGPRAEARHPLHHRPRGRRRRRRKPELLVGEPRSVPSRWRPTSAARGTGLPPANRSALLNPTCAAPCRRESWRTRPPRSLRTTSPRSKPGTSRRGKRPPAPHLSALPAHEPRPPPTRRGPPSLPPRLSGARAGARAPLRRAEGGQLPPLDGARHPRGVVPPGARPLRVSLRILRIQSWRGPEVDPTALPPPRRRRWRRRRWATRWS